ncbi:MAG: hypothetical protein WCD18_07800 [Thermosynechococcaceae cyanobacterium]
MVIYSDGGAITLSTAKSAFYRIQGRVSQLDWVKSYDQKDRDVHFSENEGKVNKKIRDFTDFFIRKENDDDL